MKTTHQCEIPESRSQNEEETATSFEDIYAQICVVVVLCFSKADIVDYLTLFAGGIQAKGDIPEKATVAPV